MNILINTSNLKVGGAIQVALSIIDELRNFPEHNYTIVLAPAISNQIDTSIFPSNFSFHHFPYNFTKSIFSFFRSVNYLKKIEKKVHPDWVFSVFGPTYWVPFTKHLMGYALPQYIFYRESPYLSTLGTKEKIRYHVKKRVHKFFFKRKSPIIHVETDQVRISLSEEFNIDLKKIFVVSNTGNKAYDHIGNYTPIDKLSDKNKKKFRLLIFSSYYPHKNLEIIEKVNKYIIENSNDLFEFVFTLPQGIFENIFPSKPKEFINLGYIPVALGPSLYHHCDALFMPTLLECFSATFPEAMKMKIPIVTSDLSFIRAICADSALYFDPSKPSDIAQKIIALHASAELRELLVKNGQKRLSMLSSGKSRIEMYLNIMKTN
jgi:glycosyltransferase involved in cell wall biosynthesis